jgi:hypothetical protein
MAPEHPRTRVAHHGFYLLPAVVLVAMDRTFRASWFSGPKPTAFKPDGGVIEKPLALRAKAIGRPMTAAAVTRDHQVQRLPLSRQSLAGELAGS